MRKAISAVPSKHIQAHLCEEGDSGTNETSSGGGGTVDHRLGGSAGRGGSSGTTDTSGSRGCGGGSLSV